LDLIDELIKKLEEEHKEIINREEKRTKELLDKLKLLKEIKKKEKKTWEDVKRAMSINCFKSLSYCCGLEKPCLFRDVVLFSLGMSKDDFLEFKKRCDKVLLEFLKEKGVVG